MLIIQKLLHYDNLTHNEKEVAQYLVDNQYRIQEISITEIASHTYTSASTTVRLAQKLGFHGFKDFKSNLIQEMNYINSTHAQINANMPFTSVTSMHDIAENITHLLADSLYDTFQLLDFEQLNQCVQLLQNCHSIHIYGFTNAIASAYDFMYKMKSINKRVTIIDNINDFLPMVELSDRHTVSLFMSYSGETIDIIPYIKLLKKKHYPTIAITSIGENSFSKLCDYSLLITTREKLYSKIGTYSSNEGFHLILDILYSCLFKQNYDQYFHHKIQVAKTVDKTRTSYVSIVQEDA